MSKKFKGRIDGPFVALLKSTIKTEAWKALSHGGRSLYVALRSRYNPTTQNAVYVSTRDAEEELGRHSNLHSIRYGSASYSITDSLSKSAPLTTALTATAKHPITG